MIGLWPKGPSMPRTFPHSEFLNRVCPDILRKLISSFPGFIEQYPWALDPFDESLGYDRLADALNVSPERLPDGLAKALFQIEEMASDRFMGQMAAEARRLKIPLERRFAAADLATILWMHDPQAFDRSHAEAKIERRRRFESFTSDPDTRPPVWRKPTEDQLQDLRSALSDWFDLQLRGKACRVHYYPRESEAVFAVCRGDYFRREGVLKNGQSSSILYRPERIDAIYYFPDTHELRVNAATKGITKTYRDLFGIHLFGDEDAFSAEMAYNPGTSPETLRQRINDSGLSRNRNCPSGRAVLCISCRSWEEHLRVTGCAVFSATANGRDTEPVQNRRS